MEELRKVQLYLLDEVVAIFDENNIDYFLDAGTLIGAIRHKGFIPWDDDIDMVIQRKDYERAIQLLHQKLPEDIEFDHNLTDIDLIQGTPLAIKYKYSSIKEQDKGTESKIFIDLFVFSPVNPKFIHSPFGRAFGRVLVTSRIPYVQSGAYRENYGNLFVFAMEIVKKIPSSYIEKKIKKIRKKYENEPFIAADYKTWANVKHVHPIEKIYPLSTLEFEGYEYKVPNDVNDYLTIKYGDYMKLPPEDQQQGHHIIEYSIEKMPINKKRQNKGV
ncbi:MAG: LicD family protein [Culicoidibacterales bacterium]